MVARTTKVQVNLIVTEGLFDVILKFIFSKINKYGKLNKPKAKSNQKVWFRSGSE